MELQIVDNVRLKTANVLTSAIVRAKDIRIAVAFVSRDGLFNIMPAIQNALEEDAYVEFLIGMDTRATDPSAVKELYTLSRENSCASLLCFARPATNAIYHPKMYLARDNDFALAIIGSSNLTRSGLTSNIEANVVIRDDVHTEIMSEIYSTYNRLKYHPYRVIPDDEFIDLFTELCQYEKSCEYRVAKDSGLKKLKKTFADKANRLQRPKPRRADLVGWLELVYDALPEGRFTNQEIYGYENEFKQHYPQNLNIKAKIRQQLQVLQKLGFIEHVSTGVWRKVS